MHTKIRRTVFAFIILLSFCGTASIQITRHNNRLFDRAIYSGDVVGYQVTAVNLAKGFGFKSGRITSLSLGDYKFAIRPEDVHKKKQLEMDFVRTPARYDFGRSPGYPIFCAIVYKIFGVSPRAVKLVQIGLLAWCAALLPVLGWWYWRYAGIAVGVIAVVLFNQLFPFEPWRLMSEELITFVLSLWILCFVWWNKQHTRAALMLLGFCTGLTLFVKGSNMFIPAVTVVYFIMSIRIPKKCVHALTIFIAGCSILPMLWGCYSFKTTGKFIMFSDQFETVVFSGNNESTIHTGSWSYNWRDREGHTYYQLRNSEYGTFRKLFEFFNRNRSQIFTLYRNKLYKAFMPPYAYIIWGMLLYYLFYALVKCQDRVPLYPLILFFAHLGLVILFFGLPRMSRPFVVWQLLPALYAPVFIGQLLWKRRGVVRSGDGVGKL